jgi:hypothetical protein
MTEEQITFIDALIDTNASIAAIAKVFPNMTVEDFIRSSTRYTGGPYRRWTAEQEHFVLKHIKYCTPIPDLAQALTEEFGFSRSEGALKSRIKQIVEWLEAGNEMPATNA